jgi:MFS family permease
MIGGMALLSTMDVSTAYLRVVIYMVALGFGIGLAMPIPNTVTQNSVPQSQIGTITSVVQFVRNIGATIGSAVFGSIMISSMDRGLKKMDLSHIPAKVQDLIRNPQLLSNKQVLDAIRAQTPAPYLDFMNRLLDQARGALSKAIHDVFLACIFVTLFGLIATLFYKGTLSRGIRPAKGARQAPFPSRATPPSS